MSEYEVIDGVRYYKQWDAFNPDNEYWFDDEDGVRWAVTVLDDGKYALATQDLCGDPHSESEWMVSPAEGLPAEKFWRWLEDDSPLSGMTEILEIIQTGEGY